MSLSVNQILDILKQGIGTTAGKYVGNLTQVRAGDRAFHLYPSIEVTIPQPVGTTTDPELKTTDEVFTVKIFVRYTREISIEKELLRQNEVIVLALLNAQPLQTGTFFFQTETFDRSETKDVHGVESTLRVLFRQIEGTVPGTVVGGGANLQIGGIVLPLIGTSNNEDGINHSELWDDDAKRFPIPDGNVGVRFWEYAWTMDLYDSVQAIIDARSYTLAKFVESNGQFQDLTVLAVRQRVSQTFSGLKTSVLQMEVQG